MGASDRSLSPSPSPSRSEEDDPKAPGAAAGHPADATEAEDRGDNQNQGGSAFAHVLTFLIVIFAASVGMLLQWRAEERQTAMSGGLARPAWMGPYVMATRAGRKYKDINVDIQASLENMWRSEAISVRYKTEVPCPHCGGDGGTRHHCQACGGRGVKTMVNRMMGMVHQVECPSCHGQGFHLSSKCQHCGGSGRRSEDASEWVHLSPGLQSGDVIRVVSKGEGHPNLPSGDLAARVHEDWSDYPHLSRCAPANEACGSTHSVRSADLYTEISISLSEALQGFRREIAHPSGRDIVLDTTAESSAQSDRYEEKDAAQMDGAAPVAASLSRFAKQYLPRRISSLLLPATGSSRAAKGESTVIQPGAVLVFAGKGLPRRTSWFDARTLHAQQGEAIAELQDPEEWGHIVSRLSRWLQANNDDGGRRTVKTTSPATFVALTQGTGGGSPALPLLGLGDVPLPQAVCKVPVVATIVGCLDSSDDDSDSDNADGDGGIGGRVVERGDLIVKVNVVFPEALTREQRKALKALLPE